MKNLSFLLILVFCFTLIHCTSPDGKQEEQPSIEKAEGSELGTISIEVSGSAEAIPHFKDGLLLLHSFEYDDAAEKFQKAQKIDSTFVMAYWGEAMTKNHPLWRAQFTDEARDILNKLANTKEERLALTKTEFEKDMMEAVELLYGDGIKEERDINYKNHLKNLVEKYPGNHEVSAFYALSLLGSVHDGRDNETYGKAAAVVKGIIEENTNHPGALHYMIHAYDDPEHAFKALEAANKYSVVAPDAAHALHMPSHIYIALGMWDEVISSNIHSYEASVKRMERKGLDNDARGYHSFSWLMYGYLQKGNYEKARTLVDDMKQYCYEKPSPKARSHYIHMRALYLNETEKWNDPMAMDTVSFEDLNVSIGAVQRFVEGSIAYFNKDKNALSLAINNLKSDIAEAKKNALTKGGKMCSGVSYFNQTASKQDLEQAEVMLLELIAYKALLNNDETKAIASMEAAVELEYKSSFSYGPPGIVKPSPELYGEFLLKKGDKSGAKLMFEKVLERAPKRLIPTKALDQIS